MRWLEYLGFLAVVVGLARPAGLCLAVVFAGTAAFLDPPLPPLESFLHRLLEIRSNEEMSAGTHTHGFLLFGAVGTVGLFVLLLAPLPPRRPYRSSPR